MLFQILSSWASLQRSQWLKKDTLIKTRNKRLKRMVNYAYREVPFYNDLYRSRCVDLGEIRGISDLRRLPPITRDDLQAANLKDRTARGTDLDSCMLRATSGTTGSPAQVLEEMFSGAYREALNLRILWAYGARPLHKLCRMRVSDPTGRKPKARLSDVGVWGFLRKHGMKQILYDTDPATVAAVLSDWKPDIIFARGAYLRVLLEYSGRLGLSTQSKIVVTSGEILDDSTRACLRDGFQSEVYDHYGMEEVGGSVAWECPTHAGYHINDESLVLEYLRDGEPVAPGEPGEIYLTSLTRTATPIIRYATGDIAIPIGEDCECGRGLSMLKDIQGRILDTLVTKNGRLVSPVLIINRLEHVRGLEQFKVVQNRDFSVDLHVRVAEGMEAGTREELEHVCADLLGDTPARIIQIGRVDHAPGQKFRIVESLISDRDLKAHFT